MKKKSTILLATLALAITLISAACAGEGDSQATPTPIYQGTGVPLIIYFTPVATMLPSTPEPTITMSADQVIVIEDSEGRQIAIQYLGFVHGFSCMSNNPLYVSLSEEKKNTEDPYDCFFADYELSKDEFNWDGPVVATAEGAKIWLEEGWFVSTNYNLLP